MIVVVDYGMGNLRSVAKALAHVAPGETVVVSSEPGEILRADRVVLPGQSAMPDCMKGLVASGLVDTVRKAMADRPFLGICLGAQMLAIQLGATVAPHPEGRAQIGYYPIRPTAAGLAVCADWPDHVYHWHREGFGLPAGAELLAEGSDFPVEALRYGHSFGFQFHPDVTTAMMHRWTTRGHERLVLPGAQPRRQHFAHRAVHDVAERAWLKHFLDGWLAQMPLVAPDAMREAAE